jgi:hypothetical protein
MGAGKPTATEWNVLPGDTVSVTLWFSGDAGSNLRLWHDSTGLHGEVASSGWMGSPPAPQSLRDSVLGRRIGNVNPSRCLP